MKGCLGIREEFVFFALFYNEDKIIEFALSTMELSREARYMRVVLSESCPIASLITPTGIPIFLAADAQLWRA